MTMWPIKVGPTARYLVESDGVTPYLLIGDTPWFIFTELSIADATTYFANRRAKGFSALICQFMEKDSVSQNGLTANAIGDEPFTGTVSGEFDFTTPNEAYWSHCDALVDLAASYGLTLLVNPAYIGYPDAGAGNTNQGWRQAMVANGTTRLRTYGEWIGNRYKNKGNLIWHHMGDRNPQGSDESLVRALAEGLASTDKNHLCTTHMDAGTSSRDWWHPSTDGWLTLNNTYVWGPRPYEDIRTDYQRTNPIQPFVFFEGRYENETEGTPLRLRYQTWWAMTGGACGAFFGNRPIWFFGSHGGQPWQNWLDTDGAAHQSIAASILRSVEWHRLVPDWGHAWMTSGFGTDGTDSFATAALTDDGTTGLVYVPAALSPVVDATRFPGTITVERIDPSTGARTYLSGNPFANSGTIILAHPGNNADGDPDWVWLLRATPLPTNQPRDVWAFSF